MTIAISPPSCPDCGAICTAAEIAADYVRLAEVARALGVEPTKLKAVNVAGIMVVPHEVPLSLPEIIDAGRAKERERCANAVQGWKGPLEVNADGHYPHEAIRNLPPRESSCSALDGQEPEDGD
jgi:hypothetical protein